MCMSEAFVCLSMSDFCVYYMSVSLRNPFLVTLLWKKSSTRYKTHPLYIHTNKKPSTPQPHVKTSSTWEPHTETHTQGHYQLNTRSHSLTHSSEGRWRPPLPAQWRLADRLARGGGRRGIILYLHEERGWPRDPHCLGSYQPDPDTHGKENNKDAGRKGKD